MYKIFAVALAMTMLSLAASADEGREAIHASAKAVQPLMPGMQAPAFTVRTVHDEAFSFDPETMSAPVVLSFYRGGWCPYCNLHLSEMRTAEAELREAGFKVWFISIDQPSVLAESLDQPDIGYTLFSDSGLEATRAFGLAFRLDDETIERYLKYGHDLEGAAGESHHVLPVPSTFIIGQDGVIRFAYSNPDYAVRLHPDVLLAAARAHMDEADKRLRQRRKAQREAEKE
jgi:peroxiredoxin